MKHTVKSFEMDLTIVGNGQLALEERKKQEFDIIFMDIAMPVMDGIEATKQIKLYEAESGLKHIPIVAVTANALKGDRERFMSQGLDEYCTKPIKKDILAGLIVGIFQFFGYAFQTYGAMLTTASKNAFFTSINVIIVPYIFWLLHKKRPDVFAFLASVICVLGVAVISFDRKMNLANLNFGDILTIISAVFFAGQIATNGYFSKKVEPLKLVVMQMFVA